MQIGVTVVTLLPVPMDERIDLNDLPPESIAEASPWLTETSALGGGGVEPRSQRGADTESAEVGNIDAFAAQIRGDA